MSITLGNAAGATVNTAGTDLRSIARAKFLDVICEGEVGGLVNGARSVFFDDTPLQNADGTLNFPDARFVERKGTIDQVAIPGFSDTENTSTVSVKALNATPVVRQFSNSSLTAVRVIIGIPSLFSTDSSGAQQGTTLTYAVDVQPSGGAWSEAGRETISGKALSRYQRTVTVPLPAGGAPWSIRLRRITADSTDVVKLQNELWWDLATEVVGAKLRMPWSAGIATSFDSKAFPSIPRRAFDAKLKLVKVPSNYNPVTRVYTGTWDGTFAALKQWTDNPAWCFYDLVTHPRYGLGAFLDVTQVDKWALYQIAQYCDGLVPDGFGGYEPRFTCNLYLSTQAEAFKVLNDFSSIFRAMLYWSSGSVTAVQDSPADPVALFSEANVVNQGNGVNFSYSGSSMKQRHTVALVTWNDPADMYRQKVEYVEDTAGIARYGVVNTEVVAMGCASRGQANRVGRWLLFTERLQTDAIAFKTGIEGAVVRPGQVIKVTDPTRAGVRMGGRLRAATMSAVTLDATLTLQAGQTYTLSTLTAAGGVQTAPVTTPAGAANTLALAAGFTEAPKVGTMWVLTCPAVDAQQFRVLSVSEGTDGLYEIGGVVHIPGKYAQVEQGLALQTRSISAYAVRPAAPATLTLRETLLLVNGAYVSRIDADWAASVGASTYVMTYQRGGGAVSEERVVAGLSTEIVGAQEGSSYTVTVYAVNPLGVRSPTGVSSAIVVQGKSAPPADVSGLYSSRYQTTLALVWNPNTDVDLDHYEVRRGDTWATGIVAGSPRANTLSLLSPRGGRYMVKAVDASGNYSNTEAFIVIPDASGINVVLQADDSVGGFGGTYTTAVEYVTRTPVTWDGSTTWDGSATWDNFLVVDGVTPVAAKTWADMTMPWVGFRGPWLFEGAAASANYSTWAAMTAPWSSYAAPAWQSITPATTGTYVSRTVDVGYVATSVVTLDSAVQLLAASQRTWASLTQPWASYGSPAWTWQGQVSAIGASYDIATSQDGSTWSIWFKPGSGAVAFRYIKTRATLSTTDTNYRPWMTKLVLNIDVPDRVAHFQNVAVGTSGATITFSPAFVGVQTVQVTLQSPASGDRFTVTGKSNTSVTINVYDSLGAAKAGVVDVDVFGYGERQ